MNKVAVIGGSGMVASRFIDLSVNRFDIVSLDEKTLDITDRNLVSEFFDSNHFDSVVNFAAYTNVDGAEAQKGDEKGLAWRLNVEGSLNLAEVLRDKNIFFVHISTDFVFPGNEKNPGPYSEDAPLPESPDGIGWYGWTKNRAEKVVIKSGSRVSVVRYGYPFRASGYELKLDWARNLLKLYGEKKLYPLFTDQIYNILFIDDLTEPLSKIIEEQISGIFHIASSNTTSPYEAGSYLLEKYFGTKVEIEKASMIDFLAAPGRTPRPRLGGLNTAKTQKTLGMKFDTWQEMVDEFVFELKK